MPASSAQNPYLGLARRSYVPVKISEDLSAPSGRRFVVLAQSGSQLVVIEIYRSVLWGNWLTDRSDLCEQRKTVFDPDGPCHVIRVSGPPDMILQPKCKKFSSILLLFLSFTLYTVESAPKLYYSRC